MTKYKKVNKSGGVTIPSALRHETGIRAGTAIDITMTESGLLLTKHTETCHICGSIENVITYNGFEICRLCSDSIGEEFGGVD